MKLFKSCIDCQDRYLGCHSKCPKYLKDKLKNDLTKKNRHKESQYENYLLEPRGARERRTKNWGVVSGQAR